MALPVLGGIGVWESMKWNKIAGASVTKHFTNLLTDEKAVKLRAGNTWSMCVAKNKSLICECRPVGHSEPREFKLPTGQKVKTDAPCYRATDIMWDPSVFKDGVEVEGFYD